MRAYFVFLLVASNAVFFDAKPQTIVGTWQLVRQTTCLDEELEDDADTEALQAEMQSRSRGTASTIRFKSNLTGDESLRLIDTRRTSGKQSFMYKYDGEKLYILDKRSRTIVGAYQVENLTQDSLVFSDAKRVCDTRVLVRVSDD